MPCVDHQWSYSTGFKVHMDIYQPAFLWSLVGSSLALCMQACMYANCKRCQTCQRRHRGTLCSFPYSIPCLPFVQPQEGHPRVLQNGHLHFVWEEPLCMQHFSFSFPPYSSSGCLLQSKGGSSQALLQPLSPCSFTRCAPCFSTYALDLNCSIFFISVGVYVVCVVADNMES